MFPRSTGWICTVAGRQRRTRSTGGTSTMKRLEKCKVLDRAADRWRSPGRTHAAGARTRPADDSVSLDARYTVLLETSGDVPLEARAPAGSSRPRCTCSTGSAGDLHRVLDRRNSSRIVLSHRGDGEFARDFVAHYALDRRVKAVLFSRLSAAAARAPQVRRRRTGRTWTSGSSRMRFRRAWDCRFTSLSGTRR